MIPTPADTFDEWMRLPIASLPEDSPFLVARARPDDFETIYDLVDAAFGTKRPRPVYDWLYKKNPNGIARCWVLSERATGVLLKTGAGFPWPIRYGDEVLRGSVGGDAATRPNWQRKGLSAIRREIRRSHPWKEDFCSISGPNAGSRTVMRKSGQAEALLGRLRGAVALLDTGELLAAKGLPGGLARPTGRLADALIRGWRNIALGHSPAASGRVETVDRFTVDYDEVTMRCMSSSDFWCPHNAEFLNWRYLDHPGETYVALALVENEIPMGYAVVLLNGKKATLSEFAIAPEPKADASGLLRSALDIAREAGCRHLNFFATPAWRHWGLFHRAGFIPYPSKNQFEVGCKRFEPMVLDQRKWQVMPGDRDYH